MGKPLNISTSQGLSGYRRGCANPAERVQAMPCALQPVWGLTLHVLDLMGVEPPNREPVRAAIRRERFISGHFEASIAGRAPLWLTSSTNIGVNGALPRVRLTQPSLHNEMTRAVLCGGPGWKMCRSVQAAEFKAAHPSCQRMKFESDQNGSYIVLFWFPMASLLKKINGTATDACIPYEANRQGIISGSFDNSGARKVCPSA